MNNEAYIAVEIYDCLQKGHRFNVFGSDKTPLKKSLGCLTCSLQGKTAVAAYGLDTQSWGQWFQFREKEAHL